MYAIFEHGGHQYKAEPQGRLRLQRVAAQPGEALTFDKVLTVRGDAAVQVGAPYVAGAQVKTRVVGDGKGPKIRIVKYKRKKHYKRQAGHRQWYTEVQVEEIVA